MEDAGAVGHGPIFVCPATGGPGYPDGILFIRGLGLRVNPYAEDIVKRLKHREPVGDRLHELPGPSSGLRRRDNKMIPLVTKSGYKRRTYFNKEQLVDRLFIKYSNYKICFSIFKNSSEDEYWRTRTYNSFWTSTAKLMVAKKTTPPDYMTKLALDTLEEIYLHRHDDHLLRVSRSSDATESSRIFFSDPSVDRELYLERIESFGSFEDARKSRFYFCLYNLFALKVAKNLWVSHRYVYYVWMPEAVTKAVMSLKTMHREDVDRWYLGPVLRLLIKDFPPVMQDRACNTDISMGVQPRPVNIPGFRANPDPAIASGSRQRNYPPVL